MNPKTATKKVRVSFTNPSMGIAATLDKTLELEFFPEDVQKLLQGGTVKLEAVKA